MLLSGCISVRYHSHKVSATTLQAKLLVVRQSQQGKGPIGGILGATCGMIGAYEHMVHVDARILPPPPPVMRYAFCVPLKHSPPPPLTVYATQND